jgi:hypothetical protein
MIKYEHNTLVLDASQNKHDQKAINDFLEYAVGNERNRILRELKELEQRLDETRTPLYTHHKMFKMVRSIVNGL